MPEITGEYCALRWRDFMQGPGRFRGSRGRLL